MWCRRPALVPARHPAGIGDVCRAVAVPLVVAGADTAFLLSADLFSSDG
jgi:hypothetical protein